MITILMINDWFVDVKCIERNISYIGGQTNDFLVGYSRRGGKIERDREAEREGEKKYR